MPRESISNRIKKTPAVQKAVGWGFEHISFLIPTKRLKETPNLIAFYHPRPCYAVHILIIPKKAVPSLLDLSAEDTGFLHDLVEITQELVRELGLDVNGYRLIVNGGKNQDFPQLHFHLVSGDTL
jgi:histidine triad (HIT) family protein